MGTAVAGPEKVLFLTNEPTTIALKFANGKRVESRYNEYEVYYTTTDGRCFYAAPDLAEQIAALRPGGCEPFTICRREVREKGSSKKRIEWDVERCQPEQQVVRPAAPAAVQNQSPSPVPNGSSSPQHTAPRTITDIMARALAASVDSLLAAREYAAAKGWTLDFNEEDVRCVANTFFIAATRNGGQS